MRWPWGGAAAAERREHELAEAEAEVALMRERAERVAGPLRERLARNHWSEAVAAIARRET